MQRTLVSLLMLSVVGCGAEVREDGAPPAAAAPTDLPEAPVVDANTVPNRPSRCVTLHVSAGEGGWPKLTVDTLHLRSGVFTQGPEVPGVADMLGLVTSIGVRNNLVFACAMKKLLVIDASKGEFRREDVSCSAVTSDESGIWLQRESDTTLRRYFDLDALLAGKETTLVDAHDSRMLGPGKDALVATAADRRALFRIVPFGGVTPVATIAEDDARIDALSSTTGGRVVLSTTARTADGALESRFVVYDAKTGGKVGVAARAQRTPPSNVPGWYGPLSAIDRYVGLACIDDGPDAPPTEVPSGKP